MRRLLSRVRRRLKLVTGTERIDAAADLFKAAALSETCAPCFPGLKQADTPKDLAG